MATKQLIIEIQRQGYTPEQCGETLTVGELKDILEDIDEDMSIYFSHDNKYTYSAITPSHIYEALEEWEEQEEQDYEKELEDEEEDEDETQFVSKKRKGGLNYGRTIN